jgi:hypothetical protein
MNALTPSTPPTAKSKLLIRTRIYFLQRERGLPLSQGLEDIWRDFCGLYSEEIRAFSSTCGAANEEIVDFIQEVWRQLLVRLPRFQLQYCRGQFDTWLFSIVPGHNPPTRAAPAIVACCRQTQTPCRP